MLYSRCTLKIENGKWGGGNYTHRPTAHFQAARNHPGAHLDNRNNRPEKQPGEGQQTGVCANHRRSPLVVETTAGDATGPTGQDTTAQPGALHRPRFAGLPLIAVRRGKVGKKLTAPHVSQHWRRPPLKVDLLKTWAKAHRRSKPERVPHKRTTIL